MKLKLKLLFQINIKYFCLTKFEYKIFFCKFYADMNV